jgi:hypothetical protein
MTAAELHGLAALLARAAELASRERLPAARDYARASDLVADIAGRLPTLAPAERERLELNADLPQLAFHLGEELAAVDRAGTVDREHLAGSLSFMRRHLLRLDAEFVANVHTRLDPRELALVTGLARLVRDDYERRFARHYRELGYRRPFIDKFYRDYSLTGVPDGLLLELAELAERDMHDVVICVLKGGLAYTLVMQLLGLPAERARHVICGRASGSHLTPSYLVRPIDFAPEDLLGRSVLVVENNAATGATLGQLAHLLREARPERVTLFLDYIVPDLGGVSTEALERLGYGDLRVGPFESDPGGRERAEALRGRLLQSVERRCAAPSRAI